MRPVGTGWRASPSVPRLHVAQSGELLWEYPIFMVMGCGVSGSGPPGDAPVGTVSASAAIWSAHDISASTGGAQLSSLWVE